MNTSAPHTRSAFRGAPTGLLGLGTYLPSRKITNEEIAERIDSSDEWIRSRSGIRVRYWAEPSETVEYMAATAAERALEHAGIDAREVGCVIVSTVSHLHQFPSLAAGVAHRIGAGAPGAFDISAGCAGFCYGLSLASDMITAGSARHVLVIAVERLSELLDPTDRHTAFLFGDGAGAAVVGPSDEPGVGPVVWGSDGSQKDTIRQTHSWAALRETPGPGMPHITMDGREVFRWAAYQLGPIADEALARAGVSAADLDAFVPHQANARITDELVKGLDLPAGVAVARSVEIHGNTSAVSVPLAIEELLAGGDARPGGLALLLSFGTGLVWAGQVVRLPPAPAGPPRPAVTAPTTDTNPTAPAKETQS
ncbi:beta-ketoacyl-ACP synthase III [Streptomyces sp. SAI-041]|uniref:beta-ketoacyl-ACP synthase III n=1 Tax=Streptomyces sp. SAI-041 TaxID=2940548 RepID=UPI002476F50D|nr:beta-ketoacyl-ACP synthase III [Streptomyces sp. SAI-041]MDH6547357.1 3-oxoacyl-[acyl-carrier-protein] synthase-3 [Streptomyces sp. SAI-041]